MRNWLIANAKAGDGKRGLDFWLHHLRAAGLSEFEIRDFAHPEWEDEVQEGDMLIVAGGDGSVSRAAALCVERNATLAVLPSGTANDFARNLGLPSNPEELCRLVALGHTEQVDVAWINGHPFLNVAHIGLGTIPVQEASSQHKKRFGRFSYLTVLLRSLWAPKGFRGRIVCGDEIVTGRWLSIAIASGAFFGGGQRVPQATANDGQLDIVAVRPHHWTQLFSAFLFFQLRGRASKRLSTLVHMKATRCSIQLRHARTLTADGDIVGEVADIEAECRQGVLRVVCERVVRA